MNQNNSIPSAHAGACHRNELRRQTPPIANASPASAVIPPIRKILSNEGS